MSGNFPHGNLPSERGSDPPNHELAHTYSPVPGHTHPAALESRSPATTESIPGHNEPPPGDQVSNPKVAIPRATYSSIPPSISSSGRVSRACESCREQKAKCSGHRPTCLRCQDNGIRCSYGDRKREKMQKQVIELNTQVQSYESVLRELYPRLDPSSAQYVDRTLGAHQLVRLANAEGSRDPQPTPGYPLAAIDHTEEDFNRDEKVQALGFVGGHSEMSWLYRLKRYLAHDSAVPVDENPDPSISTLNYFQDDTEVPNLDRLDPTERPLPHIDDKLVNDYFESVHPAFPIIGKAVFLGQYRSFYLNPAVWPGKRWMAILNMVFAIAAKHSRLFNTDSEHWDDDKVYFARAWRLSVGPNTLLDHPNLQQVQVDGLASFYLLSTGQVNRSWRIIGVAIRSAVAMGLNLRSESDMVRHVSKETRYRVWWALFKLDTVLCVMTGRPPTTSGIFCTTPLPVPFREEDFENSAIIQLITDQDLRTSLLTSLLSPAATTPGLSESSTDHPHLTSPGPGSRPQNEQYVQALTESLTPNVSLYFLYVVDLAFIMREAVEKLYAPGARRQSWSEMERTMSTLNDSTDDWFSRLPLELRFTALDNNHLTRWRVGLGFRFYTTKLIISQPCLSRLAYQITDADNPSPLCDAMARMCVQAARQMLFLLPDQADAAWLYGMTQWWCILHYLMQCTTVLLVELLTRATPGTTEAAVLVADIKKAIRWLRAMSIDDPSAQQAYLICVDIIAQHGPQFGIIE